MIREFNEQWEKDYVRNEEEDGESEDDNEDGHGSGGPAKRTGTQRRKLLSHTPIH
jgi:hypothetical protein